MIYFLFCVNYFMKNAHFEQADMYLISVSDYQLEFDDKKAERGGR